MSSLRGNLVLRSSIALLGGLLLRPART